MIASEPLPHFVDDLLGYLHETHPTHATLDGVHTHDDLLEDVSRSGIESEAHATSVAEQLAKIAGAVKVPLIFKASYDKANRSSVKAFRGPGMTEGLRILGKIKSDLGLPILTDIHDASQAAPAAEIADILQIPAFLSRQTDLLTAAAKTGRIVNVKKAQFLSGQDMFYPAQKVIEAGNEQVMLTERGNMYGYNNLVVDFRNIYDLKKFGHPVCMDCTHSVQRPGAAGDPGTEGHRAGGASGVPGDHQALR